MSSPTLDASVGVSLLPHVLRANWSGKWWERNSLGGLLLRSNSTMTELHSAHGQRHLLVFSATKDEPLHEILTLKLE